MLVKSFEILEAFREHPHGLSYAEVVKLHPRFSRVSIFRVLCSLEGLSYLERSHNSSRYVLGAKFVELGRIAESRIDLLEIAIPYMEELLKKFNENINLARVQNFELIYLKTMESPQPLRVHEMANRRVALYCSALGKAIFAYMHKDGIAEFLRSTVLHKLTYNTIDNKSELRRELRRIKTQGYAIDNEENLEGVVCIAVPILDGAAAPIAAMSISGPSTRMRAEPMKRMKEALRAACESISARCRVTKMSA